MRIAYLVNQYPKTSHSFIRREIEGVERSGHSVLRFSVRRVDEPLVDARDQAEEQRTHVLLSGGVAGIASAAIATMLRHPVRFAKSARLAWRLGRRSDRGLAIHGVYLAEACLLSRELVAAGAEHVHAHFGTNPAAIAMLAHELGGPPFSFTAHGSESFDHPAFIGMGLKIENAKFAVAVSEYGRSQMMRWSAPEHWSKLHGVRCGLDESFIQAEPRPTPDAPHLVCVARFSEEKGHLVLLEALRQLKAEQRPFRMTLVGDGHLRSEIEQFIAAHELGDRFVLAGWQDGDAVREFIEESRALVLPSFMEGLPVVLMEALALGRAVVGTHVAGVPELVHPGLNGWLVPPGSPAALAQAFRELLDATPGRLGEMGAHGRALVLERHDADTEARRLLTHICADETSPRAEQPARLRLVG